MQRGKKPHDTRKSSGFMCYRTQVMGDRCLKLRDYRDFRLFCSCDLDVNPVAFIYEFDPHSTEMHRLCKYGLQKSYIKAFESYCPRDIHTDRQTRHTTPSGVASYGALEHVPSPRLPTISFLVHFGVGLKLTAKYCVICDISWYKCQQLTFDQYCISHKTISHQACCCTPEVRRECPIT